jgi:hypothetical protein
MEKKYFIQMEGDSGNRIRYLAVMFRGLERILMVPENRAKRTKNDPDFRGKEFSIWVEEVKEKRRPHDIRNYLELDLGVYSPDFVPRYRDLEGW